MSAAFVAGLGWFVVAGLSTGARRAASKARLPVGTDPDAAPTRRSFTAGWRRRSKSSHALPLILDELSRSLRSGFSLRQALVGVSAHGPMAQPTDRMRHELELGVPIDEAVKQWVGRLDDPLADLVGTALAVVIRAGGSGADAIDRVSATLRDRGALELETRAQASQAKASATVIAVLPIGFLALATAADPTTLDFLVGTRVGLACLITGFSLDAAGLWWMHRITEAVRW